jgi:NagD protein
LQALHLNGFSIVDHSPDFVVVGEGRTITLDTLEDAVNMILEGAKLIATNLDPNCPTKTGSRPGCGATVAYLETVTGMKAFSVGKPSPIMMRAARKELHLATSQTVMIGDTMDTDIHFGSHTPRLGTGSPATDDRYSPASLPDRHRA